MTIGNEESAMSEITHTSAPTAIQNPKVRLILGLVVALGIIGGSFYGFETGMFKPDPKSMADIPDGD
jgi:hypothetical protein